MKAKKWLTIITLCVSIFSLSVACIIGKDSNCISYDVSMALLGSAVLGFIMSLTEYYVEKGNGRVLVTVKQDFERIT